MQSALVEAKFAALGTVEVPWLLHDDWVPRIDPCDTSSAIQQLLEGGRLQLALAGSRIGAVILHVAWWLPTDPDYRLLQVSPD